MQLSCQGDWGKLLKKVTSSQQHIPVFNPAASQIPVVEIGEEEVSETVIARYFIAPRLTIASV